MTTALALSYLKGESPYHVGFSVVSGRSCREGDLAGVGSCGTDHQVDIGEGPVGLSNSDQPAETGAHDIHTRACPRVWYERVLSLLATTISEKAMELVPQASGALAVARSETCPALLRTSTGRTLPVAETLKTGAPPLQLMDWLLPAPGIVGGPGIDGASTKKLTVLVPPPGAGQAPSPRRSVCPPLRPWRSDEYPAGARRRRA